MSVFFYVVCGLLLGQQGPVASQSPKVHGGQVHGIALLTHDRGLQTRLRKEFVAGASFQSLQDRYAKPTWRWFTWGQRSAILVDLSHPFFDASRTQSACLDAFTRMVDSDLTLDMRKGNDEDRASVWQFLRRTYPQLDPKPPVAGAWPKLGLRTETQVELDGAGRSARVRLIESGGSASSRNSAMRSGLFAALASPTKPEDRERISSEAAERLRSEQTLDSQWLGQADRHVPEGMRELGQRLGELIDELNRESLETALRLGAKLGLKSNLPVSGSPSELSGALQSIIRDRLAAERMSNGFATSEEASAFLGTSSQFRTSTVFSLAFAVRAGSGTSPNVYHSIEIGSYPGGIGP